MKFLHTADWQLGLRAGQLGARAAELRAERLRAARRAFEVARDTHCEFVVIAGDLFDRPDVDRAVVEKCVELLGEFAPLPVLVLPGNHDPLGEGDVWSRSEWRQAGEHVRLLGRAEELDLAAVLAIEPGNAAIYPCPLRQKQSRLDPTSWIPARVAGDERLRIGLAHGSLQAAGAQSRNFPIAADRAELSGLDYLALGDWHGVTRMGRAAYPGTIEQCSFGEQAAGYVLVVELETEQAPARDGAVATVTAEQHRVGRFTWLSEKVDVQGEGDLRQLRARLEDLARPADLVARLELEVAEGELPLIEACEELLGSLRQEAFFVEASLNILELSDVDLDSPLLSTLDRSLRCLERGEDLVDFVGAAAVEELGVRQEIDALRAAPSETVREARLLLRRWAAAEQAALEESAT